MARLPLAGRSDFRGLDRAEGGTTNRFRATTDGLRSNMYALLFGSVYVRPTKIAGGVQAGDAGMMLTQTTQTGFVGIMRALFRPTGIPNASDRATILSQKAGAPWNYGGDTPLDLQPAAQKVAPWLRNTAGQNKRSTFSSGVAVNPHSTAFGTGKVQS